MAHLFSIYTIIRTLPCSEPEHMKIPLMKETVLFYKTDPKGVAIVCEIWEEVRREGREQGIAEGRKQGRRQGRRQGMELYENLILHLTEDNRLNDLAEIAKNRDYAKKLFEEYHLA